MPVGICLDVDLNLEEVCWILIGRGLLGEWVSLDCEEIELDGCWSLIGAGFDFDTLLLQLIGIGLEGMWI